MCKLVIAPAAALAAVGRVSGSQEEDVMSPVRQFVDGFNKGDIAMAQAACVDQTFIIDDFPPHEWRGSGATTKWSHDLGNFEKKNGMSGSFVTLGKRRKIHVTGGHAYMIAFRFI
jgi:hypothetical protein